MVNQLLKFIEFIQSCINKYYDNKTIFNNPTYTNFIHYIDIFCLYIDNYIKSLDLNNDYGVCNFRLGDNSLIKNNNGINNLEKFLNRYIINN